MPKTFDLGRAIKVLTMPQANGGLQRKPTQYAVLRTNSHIFEDYASVMTYNGT